MTTPTNEPRRADGTDQPVVGWLLESKTSRAHAFFTQPDGGPCYILRALCGRRYNGGTWDAYAPKCRKCLAHAKRVTANDRLDRPHASGGTLGGVVGISGETK